MSEQPPTMNDILTAVAVLRPQTPEQKGLSKNAGTIVVAIVLALCLWVGATLVTVGDTLTKVSTSVDSIQKPVDEVKQQQSATIDKIVDLQSRVAQHDLRLNAMDAVRMKERIRIVEGQKPLRSGSVEQQVMTPDDARTVLLKAFASTGDVPKWAIALAAQVNHPPRRPWWRRLLNR